MCGSIFHAAVPLLFPSFLSPPRSKKKKRKNAAREPVSGRRPTYLVCSARVVLPDSSWTEPVPNQGPARMQHQTLSPGCPVLKSRRARVGVRAHVGVISKREILKNMLLKSWSGILDESGKRNLNFSRCPSLGIMKDTFHLLPLVATTVWD